MIVQLSEASVDESIVPFVPPVSFFCFLGPKCARFQLEMDEIVTYATNETINDSNNCDTNADNDNGCTSDSAENTNDAGNTDTGDYDGGDYGGGDTYADCH